MIAQKKRTEADFPLLIMRRGRPKDKKWHYRVVEVSFGTDTFYNLRIELPTSVDNLRQNGRPVPGCTMLLGGTTDKGVGIYRTFNADECRYISQAFAEAAKGLAECKRFADKDEWFDYRPRTCEPRASSANKDMRYGKVKPNKSEGEKQRSADVYERHIGERPGGRRS